jgi:hypothetical protein
MANRYFFATAADLLQGLERLESEHNLTYVESGSFNTSKVKTFNHGIELPSLGIATHQSGTQCKRFLVMKTETPLTIRPIKLNSGDTNFAVDQFVNPDSVILQPGGLYNNSAFILGSITSTCNSEAAKKLLKKSSAEVTRGFKKIKSFWIGPEAYQLFQDGVRFITTSVDSPREYDLSKE